MSKTHGVRFGGLSTGRLETLVDGVFAVVMTLLILDVKVPQEPAELHGAALSQQLVADLLKLRFTVLAYAISFVIAGIYWVGHHNQFPFIRRTDRTLLWINVLFLIGVVFIPFSTSLLATYPDQQSAVAVYGGNLIQIGLVLCLQWRYATGGHRLTDGDVDPRLVWQATRRILLGPAAYALAIGLSFISTAASIAIFVIVPALYILPSGVDRHWSIRAPRHTAPRSSADERPGPRGMDGQADPATSSHGSSDPA
jgi:uncharacterized membrane protein